MGSLSGTMHCTNVWQRQLPEGRRELSALAETDSSPTPSLVYGNLTLSFQSAFPREVAQGHLDVLTRTRAEQYNPAWEDLIIITSFSHPCCPSV